MAGTLGTSARTARTGRPKITSRLCSNIPAANCATNVRQNPRIVSARKKGEGVLFHRHIWRQHMNPGFFVLTVSVLMLQGCPPQNTEKTALQKQERTPQTPTHRFQITRDIDLAFDTQTGQLCKTWEWQPLGPKPKASDEGRAPQRMPGEFTPTCLSLYERYPTGVDSRDPLGTLSDK